MSSIIFFTVSDVVAQVWEEVKQIMDVGLPVAAINLVGYLRSIVSVVCMGRLGGMELAGGALAIGFTNITGYSVLSGLAMAMDPICGQALGSHNRPLLALVLRRTILLLLCASAPIAVLWLNLEQVMLGLHQDGDISRVAGRYCLFAVPDLVANSLLHPLRIYLRSKGSVRPLMWCTSLAVLLHLPLTFFLAVNLRLGVAGVAIATFSTNFNTIVFLLFHVVVFGGTGEDSIKRGTSLLLAPAMAPAGAGEEWGTLIKLAVPSCIGVCLEWWWYELMTLLAGYLADPGAALDVAAVVIQTTSLMYTLPMALASAASTRVGKELGADRPKKAKFTAVVSLALSSVASVTSVLWTTFGKTAWAALFTADVETLNLAAAVLPIVGLCELANCPQTTGCGVLRGSARPTVEAAINFYSFYLVGAPVAVAMAFLLDMGFVGMCYGLLAAQITCAVSIGAVIYHTDWEKEALKARDLVGRDVLVVFGDHEEDGDRDLEEQR